MKRYIFLIYFVISFCLIVVGVYVCDEVFSPTGRKSQVSSDKVYSNLLKKNEIGEEKNLSPREIIQRFIEADAEGARLGGEISEKIEDVRKYFLLSSGFPTDFVYEGDLVMVIKRYEIIDEYPSKEKDSYFVKVKYFCEKGVASGFTGAKNEKVVKMRPDDAGGGVITSFDCSYFSTLANPPVRDYNIKGQTETITFELIKDENQWKINSPPICPRISEGTFQKYLETL